MASSSSPGADSAYRNIERVKAYFDSRPSLHGDSHLAVDWGSQHSQYARFHALSRVTPLQGCSLLDVGCGMGHLLDWLKAHAVNLNHYEGIDVTPSMVLAARKRHPDVRFQECNLLDGGRPEFKSYDVVFASGIFYLAVNEPYLFLATMLERLFALSKHVLVFNLLITTEKSSADPSEFRAELNQLLNIVSGLSPYYCLDHSYHSADVTLAIYRDPQ